MKRIITATMVITTLITASGQSQSPAAIAKKWDEIRHLCEKYDDGADSAYRILNEQIAATQKDPVANAIWHSCMGQFLAEYCDGNRYRISERTQLAEETPADFKEWDEKTFGRRVREEYVRSLTFSAETWPLLTGKPASEYRALLKNAKTVRPELTLYDILAYRYLDYVCPQLSRIPESETDLRGNTALCDNTQFLEMPLSLSETNSDTRNILAVYQSLTKLHKTLGHHSEFARLTIARVDFLREHGLAPDNSETWYINYLTDIGKSCEGTDTYGFVAYRLARLYVERGELYNEAGHPEYRNDLATALALFKQSLKTPSANVLNQSANYIQEAKECIKTLELKYVGIDLEEEPVAVGAPNLCRIHYKNLKRAYVRLVPVSYAQSKLTMRDLNEQQFATLLAIKPAFQQSIDLPDMQDYRQHEGYYGIPGQPAGDYMLMISDKPFPCSVKECSEIVTYQVTDIALYQRQTITGWEFLVVDRTTGEPLENARITGTDKKNRKVSCETDKNGLAQMHFAENNYTDGFTVEYRNQRLHTKRTSYWWGIDTNRHVTKDCQLLTDRMLYRPGQTLYFKGVCSEKISENGNTQDVKLLKGLTVTVKLEDANWQPVGEMSLTTNEFGSVDSFFVLPENGLTGLYHLRVVCDEYVLGSKDFSVEEYKRPTFEVTLNVPDEAVKLGQTVEVEGVAEALAGYPIAEAEVSYKVQRQSSPIWGRTWKWWNQSPAYDVLAGTAQTDADGRFRIEFPTEDSPESPKSPSIHRYLVTATVTDITGETHTSTTQVFVSRRSLLLDVNIPEEIEVHESDNRFPISLTNISDVPQEGVVKYEILKLTPPDHVLYPKKELDVVITSEAELQKMFPMRAFHGENASENWPSSVIDKGKVTLSKEGARQFAIPKIANLPSGYYRICFKVQDPGGEWVEETKTVHLYRREEKECTAYNALWCDCPEEVTVGNRLCVRYGSSLDPAHVYCEIWYNDSLLSHDWEDLPRTMNTFIMPVGEEMEGYVKVRLFLMADNRMTEFHKSVRIVNPRHEIRFEFLRFRDKTLPGSTEEYQIRLNDKDGKPISAEMLCTMYDFSLDVLGGSNPLNIGFPFSYHSYPRLFDKEVTCDHYRFHYYSNYIYDYCPGVCLPFNNFNFYASCVQMMAKRYYGMPQNQEVVLNVVEDNISVNTDLTYEWEEAAEEPAMAFIDEAKMGVSKAPTVTDNSTEQVRTNFNETAFFYPQLRTDERGDVFISFTMPDALTKWKMQGVAHNPDLMTGRFEKFVQTAKDVMIVPNAPRFFREGDTMDFSAKVVNMSGRNICGYVTLQMFNAVNNQPILMICDEGTNDGGGRDAKFCVSTTTGTQQYEIPANTSSEIHFRIVVPEDVPAVTYRIVAHNTDPQEVVGDGEEKTLPVLTNRMMVTETMPFYISGKGEKTFTFNKLQESFDASGGRDVPWRVSTLKHYRLTVECTPNPVWYAIQAMPYMMEYPHECNEQRFSRYYANALATHILKANPVIEEVFNRWQVESPDAFCSALEKNQELKQVMLEETPWVLDAQREGANKQALAAMFDFKRMSKEEAATLKKLQQAQNGDGGWPWFSGGKSSDFITRHIVAGFGHLKALGVSTDVANSTLRNAVSYMDAQMYQRYLDCKKYHYNYVDETHYLYARSFYKQNLDSKYKAAYDTCYKALLKGWKDETFYTQAMIALTAWRNGDQQVAREIVAYLKSMAQHDEEMGMFWKKQGGGWFWYEQPVERQAMLIEAFHTITPEDKESLAQMQLWLLKQKQTQHWGTTKSTTEAVYSLLLNKTLVADDKTVAVTVGNVRLPDETVQTEAGTGYFKKAWAGEEITADKANVRIEKGTDGPAWGGLYWQYFENLDKITRSDDKNLVIEKQLFKVENTDKGEVLKAITEGQPLQKGDKVRVRVVITADRDMEFVHLKDMRAATFEPVNVFSQYKYQDGLWYYEATKDAATHFFIDWMPKGKYVFEYTLFATQSGDFSNGITHIECMYAPEFQSHSQGVRVRVR
ncbi:MAG: hypothetical protein II859_13495 [Bacteroidales bacterium]|nr:hypothetical protein [Bacteroidales bacterium]